MKPLRLVYTPRRPQDTQIYIQSFCEAYLQAGGRSVVRYEAFQRGLLKNAAKLCLLAGARFPSALFGRSLFRPCYLVPSRGGHLLKSSLPYALRGEIVPMLWDCWPDTWPGLERSLKRLDVRLCFVTASDVAAHFRRRMPGVEFVHVPEGVDTADYSAAKPLSARSTDVYELGRRHPVVHAALLASRLGERCRYLCGRPGRKGPVFAFDTWKGYCAGLADTKITVSFPRSMTDTSCEAVETMTMRYFEAMLSGCVIVGHAPRELVELVGYDPVVPMDMSRPAAQLLDLLSDIRALQPLVDRNRRRALEVGPWSTRMPALMDALRRHGYAP